MGDSRHPGQGAARERRPADPGPRAERGAFSGGRSRLSRCSAGTMGGARRARGWGPPGWLAAFRAGGEGGSSLPSRAIMQTVSPLLSDRPGPLKITGLECHVLLAPDFDPGFTSSAQDSLVVVVHTDGGVSGVGECDVNPWMAKACIEAPGTHTMGLSIRDLLIGSDPFEIGAFWEKAYYATAMNGRRGVVIHALSAVEMALWDLCGKAAGKPVHALLGARRAATSRPMPRCSRRAIASRTIATRWSSRR